MIKIRGALKTYSWGDSFFIDSLLGKRPDGSPKAELWFGAHPSGPSTIDRTGSPLAIEGFPFLLKALAIGSPLSLQVHPSLAQAQSGSYADKNQKAEVFCALAPSVALCGFLPLERIKENFGRLLKDNPFSKVRSHKEFFDKLLGSPAVLECFSRQGVRSPLPFPDEPLAIALALARSYPNDIAAAAPLFLNTVRLAPGQALFVPPRVLHCHIRGNGIELMNSSDNVLRAGLTTKEVKIDEVRKIAAFRANPPQIIEGRLENQAIVYPLPPKTGFGLSKLSGAAAPQSRGAFRIILCVEGKASVGAMGLGKGEAVLVYPDEDCLVNAREGIVFLASGPRRP